MLKSNNLLFVNLLSDRPISALDKKVDDSKLIDVDSSEYRRPSSNLSGRS